MTDDSADKLQQESQLVKPPDRVKSAYWHLLAKHVSLMGRAFRPSIFGLSIDLRDLLPGRRAARTKSLEKQKMALVKELVKADIDPGTFDVLLANDMDRWLKVRFGIVFLFMTFLFTAASYAIVILDGVLGWEISQVAITALIIETPIQFIGLLYIIARNLFPQANVEASK